MFNLKMPISLSIRHAAKKILTVIDTCLLSYRVLLPVAILHRLGYIVTTVQVSAELTG